MPVISRLLKYESSNVLFILSLSFVVLFGLYSFNKPNLFNLVYFCLVIVLTLLHAGHRDLITLFLLLGVSRVIGELCVRFFDFDVTESFEMRMLTYSIVGYVSFILRYQLLAKLILLSLMVVIPIEIYWFMTQYSAPRIHYYYITLMHTVVLRYVLMMRAGLFRFVKGTKPQNIDYNLSELMWLSAIFNLTLIAEYLVRHLTGIDILIIYISFPYIQHTLACMGIMIILFYTLSHPKMLKV
jgi:hypothetical protein